ncbi:MAG: hypothetical protein ACRDT6_20055 [Micromonosporaceae bacterium]
MPHDIEGAPQNPWCPAAERRVLPYGGDKAVARSIYHAHRPSRRPWTDTCTGCGEKSPCRERRDSALVLGVAP